MKKTALLIIIAIIACSCSKQIAPANSSSRINKGKTKKISHKVLRCENLEKFQIAEKRRVK